MALHNRALIKQKMGNVQKALFDIETAIEVNNVYDNTWYSSLNMYMSLQNEEKIERGIKYINRYYQSDAFDEFVNKFKHFDVKWFKHLVDSCTYKAMVKLNNINEWQSLCNQQYGTSDYTRWYDTAVTWYNKYNNAPCNHTHTDAFFEKVYYMHKSRGCILLHNLYVIYAC